MIIKVESNPTHVDVGDIVLYYTYAKKTNKRILHVGEVVKPYGEGYCVRNIKTNKIDFPYTQSTVLVNEGIEIRGVRAELVETDKIW